MATVDIWSIVKMRLGLANDSLKPLIETYIDEIEHRILSYCHLSHVPDALKFVWASMVVDVVRVELATLDEIDATTYRGESIKIGDTSVNSSNSSEVTHTSKSAIESIVTNYRVDLNQHRKLRW
ncbi:DNA-packaging protein [Paenibacillus larvae]|nr:DNA-packaging protein [Paenibacillus larvae]AQZ45568.1 DNA-packaging protein [Paenibacillus larvae subsp. pulvifaciens]AVF27563.1 hypothetical protein ERICIII_03453 [Paenibacillus larvae subsp. larvae]MBH0344009.1 DNA-packaging protein [Paenibacillus larvae]MCY7520903.1 DNA-packaging protein [Paenibacillus larvae]MCY9500228.1 DNA-packaging protein [Paenibacillus larvae]